MFLNSWKRVLHLFSFSRVSKEHLENGRVLVEQTFVYEQHGCNESGNRMLSSFCLWRFLRLPFTFVLASSWVHYLVLLSRWVRYHGHIPRSWYVPNVVTHSDSKVWHSSYVVDGTLFFESPWKSRVTFATVSPQVPPIFVVIIVFYAPGIQLGI